MSPFLDLFAQSSSVLHMPDGGVTTAHGLAQRAAGAAAQLRAHGLVPGDRVALWMPNGVAYLDALLACAAARLVAVSVNTRFSKAEADDLVARSGAKVVLRGPLPIGGEPVLTAPEGDKADKGDEAQPDDPFLVFTTSGTTNKPKMVLHDQRSIAVHGHHIAAGAGYRASDVAMVLMPLCGTFGVSSLTGAIAAGCTVVLEDGFDAERTSRTISVHGVTILNGSDDMFHRLVESGADLRSIRIGGFARFNTSLDGIADRADAIGARLAGLYGMSEVQALFAHRDPALALPDRARPGGAMLSAGAAYRIVEGELALRGPSLFRGYLAEGGACVDAHLTASAHRDGWFKTGDLAEAEGPRSFAYITRMNDVLRLGGFLVAPAEIEHSLMDYPGIAAAHVVAVDRPRGTRPVAFVISERPVNETAVIAHCRSQLARYKVPIAVLRIDEFPTTPSANGNKIQSVKLRALALAHLSA